MPKDNELPGWVEDTTVGSPGVEAAYTTGDIEAIIDGAHDPYRDQGCNGFAKQDYTKTPSKVFQLQLFLWDMKTAAGALAMYEKKKADDETGGGLTFETIPGAKDAAVLASDSPAWKAHAYKGHYVFKVYGNAVEPKDLQTLKPDVIAFVNLLLGKLP